MGYEWDEGKNQINIGKHGIDFRDAVRVFDDPNCMIRADNREDYGEERFQIMGFTPSGVLVVIFTEREEDVTRIISAREATKSEKKLYRDGSFY